jgi:short-subunit dehydrogenase
MTATGTTQKLKLSWHWGAYTSGLVVILTSIMAEAKIVKYLQYGAFLYLLLNALDVFLTRYQLRHFEPILPQPKHYALITGASAGIGRQIAYQLAEKKFSLILAARNEDVLHRMRCEIELVNKVEVEFCPCDLSTEKGIKKLLDFIKEKKMIVDFLINNVGASEHGVFHELLPEKIEHLMTLNLFSLTRITREIVPQMIKRKNGRILNIASLAAFAPSPYGAIYSASKAFIVNFSQGLTYELRNTGVTATCFCPGPVETNFAVSAKAEKIMLMKMPFIVNDAKECAKAAIEAMCNAKEIDFDTSTTHLLALLYEMVVPRRIALLVSSIMWNEPSKAVEMLK